MVLMLLIKILNTVKLKRKMKMFKANSVSGENLVVSMDSFCESEKKENFVIGDNCELCGRFHIRGEGKVSIGNNTTIRYGSIVISSCGISIGDNVIISNNVLIYDNNSHPTDPKMREEMSKSGFHSELWSFVYADKKPVVIEDNVWIGERTTILKGVRIGKGSIVASNAVVTKDVPPYTIVAGNPAKIVKKIEGYE